MNHRFMMRAWGWVLIIFSTISFAGCLLTSWKS